MSSLMYTSCNPFFSFVFGGVKDGLVSSLVFSLMNAAYTQLSFLSRFMFYSCSSSSLCCSCFFFLFFFSSFFPSVYFLQSEKLTKKSARNHYKLQEKINKFLSVPLLELYALFSLIYRYFNGFTLFTSISMVLSFNYTSLNYTRTTKSSPCPSLWGLPLSRYRARR